MALSRASVGIYLALMQESFPRGSKVIVPANICYAAVYPVIYAGLEPAFCDVDEESGNVTFESFSMAYAPDTVAAIIPHMYGNPVEQMPEIASFCAEHKILLIEDCASAMGASSERYALGTVGDYVIYSTGYSKTLDLGFGGFLFSSGKDLGEAERMEKLLPELTQENEENMAFFSRLYRLMRNEGKNTPIERMIILGLAEACRTDFLHRISEEKKQWLFSQLDSLPGIIADRRKAMERYKHNLEKCSVRQYPYARTAVPWRFNLFLEGDDRRTLIRSCLEKSLPVSDWYPSVTNLFSCESEFPGAKKHEEQILNFPLLISEEKIDRICEEICTVINKIQTEVKQGEPE